jgi:ribosomal protein L25 (general stress protein Ctc)
MKTIAAILVLVAVWGCAAYAADQPKVTIEARDTPIKDFVSQLSQQSGASIVLDPKAQGTVSISLKDAELSQALDTVAKLNKLAWKKLQFAKPTDETVKLDQIKSAMLTLASMQMVGLSVEDPASKTSTVFAKDLSTKPDTAAIKLPEGYSWATVYVLLAPEPKDTKPTGDSRIAGLSTDIKQRTLEIAGMTPEQRQQVFAGEMAAQMSLAPEVRRAMLADQMRARFSDPQYRDQYREDMHSVFNQLRGQGQLPDFGRRGPDSAQGGGHHGGRGQNRN